MKRAIEMSEHTVLVMQDLPFDEGQWARLTTAIAPDHLVSVPPHDDDALEKALAGADIALLADDLDERHLAASNLRWIHCDHAGLTRSARPAVFERDLIVTGSAGRSAPALAEHAFMFMLALSANLVGFYEAQKRKAWRDVAGMESLRALSGRTLGIIGMGHTGVEIAARAKAFGLKVLGYRRSDVDPPPGVDRMFSAQAGDTPAPLLAQSDIVVLAVSLSDATHHMIDAAAIAQMKPRALLINMGRGGLIDEPALVAALRKGRLGGAGLDVFETEPLPQDSPLWSLPNTLITPHFTAPLPDRSERSLRIILENLQRFRSGEPMLNRISREDVYTH